VGVRLLTNPAVSPVPDEATLVFEPEQRHAGCL